MARESNVAEFCSASKPSGAETRIPQEAPPSGPIWELGGEFHWEAPTPAGSGRGLLPKPAVLFGSGRQALYAILREGRRSFGWRVCYLPGYICESVIQAVRDAEMECRYYPVAPLSHWEPDWPAFQNRQEVLVSANLLGLQGRHKPPADWPDENRIEDHTHDPWSRLALESRAGYCLVSLRKTLPIPDGAAVWSPLGLPCPAPSALTESHALVAGQKLTAMLLKQQYLLGMKVEKSAFRQLQIQSEAGMEVRPASQPLPVTPAILGHLSWASWRSHRAKNAEYLTRRLARVLERGAMSPGRRGVLPGPGQSTDFLEVCPFAVILLCADGAERDRLRKALIHQQIYPPVYWPLPAEIERQYPLAADFAARMLALPCDFRYSLEDMEEVVRAVERFFVDRE